MLLRNARLVLPDRIAETAHLIIHKGLVGAIYENSAPAAFDSEIDLDGLTLFPGFIDFHLHGAASLDSMAASADDLSRIGQFLATKGVTAWLPTLVPASENEYQQAIQAIEQAMTASSIHSPDESDEQKLTAPVARILGVHYEGPFVNSEQCGALHREHFRTFRENEDLDSLPVIGRSQAIHLMTMAPEVSGGLDLIKELRKRNWIVSIGHTRATPDLLDQALGCGARHMTHFMNAMTPLHHRSPGAVGWGLVHDEVSCDMIADGIHIDPAVLKLIVRNKTAQRISLISDAIAAAGMGDGEFEIWGETITVKDGRTANTRGSIAGSVITMLDAVRLMLNLGISEPEVALMSSLNPARLLGIDDDCGSIESGKRADLIALDHARNVRLVWIGGQVAYSSS